MKDAHQCRVAVYGAGAIGCLLAARLAQAGCEVTMIARGKTLAALRQHGVGLTVDGVTRHYPVRATDEPRQVRDADYLILAVKQQALDDISAHLAPMLAPQGAVVPAVNGIPWWYLPTLGSPLGDTPLQSVDGRGALRRALPLERVLGAVVYIAANATAPGIAAQNARNNLILGEPDGSMSARANRLAGLLQASGLQCEVSGDILQAVWIKAMGNATFNPLSVLARATMEAMVQDPYLGKLARAMLGEYLALGQALGLELPVTVEQRMQAAASAGAAQTSMLQDALQGKPLETDALVGAMIEIAAKLNLDMPHANTVWGLIRHRSLSAGSI
ncbi:2-dehydropantoate 2-reductase [Achromobacter aegrifaciens]|uniref:ketopantoate reductase family protein n=1 Tax=Achromobacter aegrifaciens TaxID=1287736 RepID=UPI0027926BD0|nr:2-dehydropantoate 2-reductase [Achromobacter aegrifaciens]MDQ1760679.1 2-dehydropantoate 2-reductase [Achromobacter aegrifaciens]